MQYEMQNLAVFEPASKVGQSKRNDDWKRERKLRKQKRSNVRLDNILYYNTKLYESVINSMHYY